MLHYYGISFTLYPLLFLFFCSLLLNIFFFFLAERALLINYNRTYSEVIKDKLVPEKILGRVSAFELALVPLGLFFSSTTVYKITSTLRIPPSF